MKGTDIDLYLLVKQLPEVSQKEELCDCKVIFVLAIAMI